jgi:hypothetical protein
MNTKNIWTKWRAATHAVAEAKLIYRVAAVVLVLCLFALASYGSTRAFARLSHPGSGHPPSWGRFVAHNGQGSPGGQGARDSVLLSPFISGTYLVAYVLVSSDCGWCAQKSTKDALRLLRDSLAASQRGKFAALSIVGVALDEDVEAGMKYLHELNQPKVFDQVSLGGIWLNELVLSLVWRQGPAKPALPQIVLVRRYVDTSKYPDYIQVNPDSTLATVVGRDSIVAWIHGGAHLPPRDR